MPRFVAENAHASAHSVRSGTRRAPLRAQRLSQPHTAKAAAEQASPHHSKALISSVI